MASEIQTVTLAGQAFEIGERSEFEPLPACVRTVEDGDLPKLPKSDGLGNYPAVPHAQPSVRRKIIRRRKTAGLTQADLPRRAGIRPPTLNRPENTQSTPDAANRDQDHSPAEAKTPLVVA